MDSLSIAMDVYSKLKNEISNYSIGKITQNMVDLAAIIILVRAIILPYYNFFDLIQLPLLSPFGGNPHFICLLTVVLYWLCNTVPGLECIINAASKPNKLAKKFDSFTIACSTSLVSFICAIFMLLASVKSVIDYENGVLYNALFYACIAVLYFLYRVYGIIQRQQKPMWDLIEKEYTGLYDSERNEIIENALVIFKGKEYSVRKNNGDYYLVDPRKMAVYNEKMKLEGLIEAGEEIILKKSRTMGTKELSR